MKLPKLPDRTPVKMSIVLTPSLARRLLEYADFYAESYGSREEVAELIPFMLEAFLDGDAAFKKVRQKVETERPASSRRPLGGRPHPGKHISYALNGRFEVDQQSMQLAHRCFLKSEILRANRLRNQFAYRNERTRSRYRQPG